MAQVMQTVEPRTEPVLLENNTPGTLTRPAYVMNAPFSYSTNTPNNPWMEELPVEKRGVDRRRAMVQFLQLYRYLSSDSVVFLVPTPRGCALQDLVFTANLGVVLEHVPGRDVAVISNFTSEPRRGETNVGLGFFAAMGYQTIVSPHRFEGDADLKHLRDNVYVGGYGIRSERETYEWMERAFDMRVIKVGLTDPYLYHLDCSVFPITREDTLVCTELFEKDEVAEIARHTNVIDVSLDASLSGVCNSVRLYNSVLNASNIHDLKAGTEDYAHEIAKNRCLEDIAARLALDVSFFNLSEFLKGGALLSCLVMHLNRTSYDVSLL